MNFRRSPMVGRPSLSAFDRSSSGMALSASASAGYRLAALDQAEKLLRQHHLEPEPSALASISIYRRLLTSGRLPSIGPVDDLQHAPID